MAEQRVALVFPHWSTSNPYPPLGIAYIAAVLQRHGYAVALFDFSAGAERDPEQTLSRLAAFSPDVVGITCLTNAYQSALELATFAKECLAARTVLGGPHVSVFPEEALGHSQVDFVIGGEGESSMLRLLRASPEQYRTISGLGFKEANRLVISPPRPLVRNLDGLPFPARHLLDMSAYPLATPWGEKMTTVTTSRGCPHACVFCYKGVFGREFRARSPENVLDEIRQLRTAWGYRCFYFNDDAFTFDYGRVERFCGLVRAECLDIQWQCSSRVDTVDAPLLERMKGSGCFKIHFGVESGNNDVLRRMNKGIQKVQVVRAVRAAKKAGIRVRGYFMLGSPGDTRSTMRETIALAEREEFDEVLFSIATPFPGSKLWEALPAEDDHGRMERFRRAYYFARGDDVTILHNLSSESDEVLEEMLCAARALEERKFAVRKEGEAKHTPTVAGTA